MALLHGPPGLGKTTLGHVLAATAGYVAVEMNASDDRSKEKFKEKFEASTQVWLLKQLQLYFLLVKFLKQVWSPTQFYSVDFSKSRIGVKKCVFNKRTIKVCVSCC